MKILVIVLSFIALNSIAIYGANLSIPQNQNPPVADNVVAGDANSSGYLDLLDALFLVKYLEGVGITPNSLTEADANGDCHIDLRDVTYIVDYCKGIGPTPQAGNCH